MAAGLGYKEFSTGDVLTAADANGYLASQVVMVFASAAARTSAIASPQEGMISYLKDTNSTEYYSGSAWVAIGGAAPASGLTLVKTQTIGSAVSAVTVTGAFSSTYDNYLITVSNGSGSVTGGYCKLTLGSTAAGYYQCGYYMFYGSSTVNGSNINNGANWEGSYFSANNHSANITLQSPYLSKATVFENTFTSAESTTYTARQQGFLNNTTSYTAFTLTTAGGTITGGEIRVYGYQNS
jgi:hypothetical protein